MMHAYLVLLVAVPALGATYNRAGTQREIDSTRYNQVPKIVDYILNDEYLAMQKNRAKLVTKLRPEEALAADNVILESNIVKIVKPTREEGLVRRRRGYNLENVRVPARYPYLPVARFNRFRRWG